MCPASPQSWRNTDPSPGTATYAAVLTIVATITESRPEGLYVHFRADITTAVLLYAKPPEYPEITIRAKPPHVQELYGLIYAPTASSPTS
ncbi:hypothetical protein Pisl_1032 [Pyrobaculum islandicum DSM 4184]|uniref:Uncharacterized protein n=1 Tax=Pyrobaculum islandicum (strain DSM 4184 / JCM 9189 / GEO3) TaxID=384616 RepID=A1RTC4_PYRIL|nr:hypothetical protein [Pyrobaculum islandicum]ABL88206.1 hypothetical protein Pisl_1032 [Pyrobaculum islandicum DSM 4184]